MIWSACRNISGNSVFTPLIQTSEAESSQSRPARCFWGIKLHDNARRARMKRVALLLLLGACFVPGAFAQDSEHIQVGIYADYFRLAQTNTNFAGLGGRFAFQAYKQVKLEAEMSYDFNKVFTENFTDPATTQITVQRSNLHLLHGMVGPRVNIGHHAIQPFLT